MLIDHIEQAENVSLKEFSSIRIGGRAKRIFFPKDEEEVRIILRESLERGVMTFPIGLGSNVIFSDSDLKHFFISTNNLKNYAIRQVNDEYYIDMLAGMSFKTIVSIVKKLNLEGFENLSGIPATIGGAVYMNAGAYGTEIMDLVQKVYWLDEKGDMVVFYHEDIIRSYRYSQFQEGGFIYRVIIKLKKSKKNIKKVIKEHLLERNRKQPLDLPTSGSTYKNPLPYYAGKLLEEAGFKGRRIGNVGFSSKHANFLVNYGDGKFADLMRLLEEAEEAVFKSTGIELEREVRIVE